MRIWRIIRKIPGVHGLELGIKANPEKIRAVLEMQAPCTTKQLQQLTGRIAALNRFISRSTDKCLTFFKIFRMMFVWSNECEEAFGQLKEYLAYPPLLSSPEEGEILYLYLAISPSTVSSVLVREEFGLQKPVYFTSRVLHGAEGRYPRIEKVGLRPHHFKSEVETIFPSTCYKGAHRISFEESIAEA